MDHTKWTTLIKRSEYSKIVLVPHIVTKIKALISVKTENMLLKNLIFTTNIFFSSKKINKIFDGKLHDQKIKIIVKIIICQ